MSERGLEVHVCKEIVAERVQMVCQVGAAVSKERATRDQETNMVCRQPRSSSAWITISGSFGMYWVQATASEQEADMKCAAMTRSKVLSLSKRRCSQSPSNCVGPHA